MAGEKVTLTHGDHPGVRILALTDPDRRNAIGPQLRDELAAAVAAVAADGEARALVVTGAGRAFCAGADLPAVFGQPDRPVAEIRRDLQAIYRSFLVVAELTIPTIAAVQGPAVGAGLNLAMCCDLRIAGPQATFAATFTRLGLHPGGGCTHFLVRALGPQRALAMLLDGGTLTAEEAVQRGLALSVAADPVATATAAAAQYAALDPELVRDIKRSVQLAETAGLGPTLEFESWAQASTATGDQIRAAVAKLTTPPGRS
ncbi:enoyl-CoA hydratase [Natronosporangium hydrolyticum]|uniref:Enoyl-CoA hydratase n=1 Tax=Natronosporangium hydrolyticum TaxID=2811111 RepID=A0A895YNX8_9ACTN|nr:enoyl-CoA hydratase [Natronosporangium hydrolyticum]QSB16416.1 enoyl-CoA hydratase [Natronosporangium hydrolyticum]